MSSRIRLGALEDCSPLVSVLTFTWAISAPEFPRESFFKVRTSQQSAVFHLSASHEKDKNSTLLFKSGFQLCGHSGCGLNSQHRKGKGKYEKRSEFYPSIVNFKARRPVSGISVHGEARYSSIVQEEGCPRLPSVVVIVSVEQETLKRRKGLPGWQVTVYHEEKS